MLPAVYSGVGGISCISFNRHLYNMYCISFELPYHYRFLSRGRERFLPSARYLYRSFLQYPEYLDHSILRISPYYDN